MSAALAGPARPIRTSRPRCTACTLVAERPSWSVRRKMRSYSTRILSFSSEMPESRLRSEWRIERMAARQNWRASRPLAIRRPAEALLGVPTTMSPAVTLRRFLVGGQSTL